MDAIIGNVVDFGMKKFKSTIDFDENLETLERNVKLLSDKAHDVKTEVENQERSGNKKRKREVESWFDEVMKIEEGLRVLKEEVTRGKKNGGALEKINGRVGELLEQSRHFGTVVHDRYEREECPLLAPQVHEETSKQNLEVIWTWLHDENVSSVGIYGMGGVGKTTLANHIHNRLVNEHRYKVHWITVSQGFRIKGLQEDLAKIVHLGLSNEEEEQIRAAQLNQAFKLRKNIVIILDDVWDRLCLEKLGVPLGVEGCKLIVTTRSYEVCKKMGCQKLRKVKKLNTDDAWELFRRSLGCETPLSPDMGETDLDELPNEILPKLSQLQYLNLPLCVNPRGEDLASLELLEQFGGRFCDLRNFNKFMRIHHNCEKVWQYDIFVGQDISHCFGVSTSNQRRMIIQDYIIEADGGEEAKSIILPHCIDKLEIRRCHGLSSCLVDNFLSHTTSLRGLTCEISNCDDIEWIVNVSSHGIRFHCLTVRSMENLVGLCKGNIASHTFSGLTKLFIDGCPRMKKLFPRAIIQDLQNLETLHVEWCKEMEEIIGREEGEGSSQSSNPQITSTTTHLPKLKQLRLFCLPELTRICEGKLTCDSLEQIILYGLPVLRRLPFYTATINGHPFPSLREIEVEENWWEALEWEQSHLKTLFQPYITSF